MGDKMIYKKFYFKNYKGIKEKVEIDIDQIVKNHIALLVIMKAEKQLF